MREINFQILQQLQSLPWGWWNGWMQPKPNCQAGMGVQVASLLAWTSTEPGVELTYIWPSCPLEVFVYSIINLLNKCLLCVRHCAKHQRLSLCPCFKVICHLIGKIFIISFPSPHIPESVFHIEGASCSYC